MKHCIDIYKGWIVAFVDGQWRMVHIEPGWVTFARWKEPNEHLGICRDADISANGVQNATELATSPHALVAGPIQNPDILERIAYVRFGRFETLNYSPIIADGELIQAIAENVDDRDGLSTYWPRFDPPRMPGRWVRTPRSLIIS